MTDTVTSPSGKILRHSATKQTTPKGNAEAKEVRISAELRVLKIGGSTEVAIFESAKYRVTGYNQTASEADKQRVKWKVEVKLKQGGLLETLECEKDTNLFQIGKGEMTIPKAPLKWSHATIKVYAYLKKPNDEASVQTKVNFKPFLIAESTNKPKVGVDWAAGDYTPETYEAISPACKKDSLLKESDQDLLAHMQALLSYFSEKDPDGMVNRMFKKFSDKQGGEFSDPTLTRMAKSHENTKAFIKQIETSFSQARKTVSPTEKLDRTHWSRLFFSTDSDRETGLMILVDAVWAYSIELSDFELTTPNHYNADVKISLFDHFGLDEEDIKTYGGWAPWNNNAPVMPAADILLHPLMPRGFRSWFILQRLRGYQPILTKMEFQTSFENAW